MNKVLLPIIGLIISTVLIISGCKKDKVSQNTTTPTTTPNASPKYDSTGAIDEITASFILTDSKNICDAAVRGQAVDRLAGLCEVYRKFDTTINSTLDTALDVNFGPTDCACLDGRLRKGHILVYWNSRAYFDSAAIITMTFNGYSMNDISITGNRALTNISKNISGMQNWSFSASISLNYPNHKTASWTASRTGYLTLANALYYYAITGTANGFSQIDSAYSVTITNPIYLTANPWWVSGGCAWFECGNLTITSPGFTYPVYINYGNIGTCDNQAMATINNSSYTITLP